MKRMICIFLTVLVLASFLASCGDTKSKSDKINEPRDPRNQSFGFDDYQEIYTWFSVTPDGDVPAKTEVNLGNLFSYKETYLSFVDRMINKDILLKVPTMDGEVMKPCSFENGNQPFSVFTWENFDRPQIFYWTAFEQRSYYIRIGYLTKDELAKVDGKSITEVLAVLMPDADIKNYNKESFSDLYETELALADKTVSALCAKSIEHRTYYFFVYGDLLVVIGDGEYKTEIKDDFWKKFGFKAYDEMEITR